VGINAIERMGKANLCSIGSRDQIADLWIDPGDGGKLFLWKTHI